MQILKNQPVMFWTEGARAFPFPIPFESGDPYIFQLKAADVYYDYSNWCTQGDMSSSTGWTFGASGVTITGGEFTGTATSNGEIANSYYLQGQRYYRVTFTITENTGTITCLGHTAAAIGTWSFIYTHTLETKQFAFSVTNGGAYTITNIDINDITDNYSHVCYVANSSGTHQGTLATPTVSGEHLAFDADLGSYSLTSGSLYDIKVLDPIQNTGAQNFLPNGNFVNKSDSTDYRWTETLTGSNTITIGFDASTYEHQATYAAPSVAAQDVLTQANLLTVGDEYEITFNIDSIAACTVRVYCGTAFGSSHTTTGSKTDTITCTANQTFTLQFVPSSTSGACVIGSINISKTTEADYTPDYQSNQFDFKDADEWCNTLLIRSLSVYDNLDFEFTNTASIFAVRLAAELGEASYDPETSDILDSAGRRSYYHFQRRKALKLFIGLYPDFIHDYLSTLGGYDNIYVGDDEYSLESDVYRVSWIFPNIGEGEITLGEREQKTISNNMSTISEGVDVASSGSFLIDPSGNFIVDPSANNITAP